MFSKVHLRVVFLGGNGELDLQTVENGGERAQVRHQAGNIHDENVERRHVAHVPGQLFQGSIFGWT